MPNILIPQYNCFYKEGNEYHVYILVHMIDAERVDLSFTLAKSEEEAIETGKEHGEVIYCNSLMNLFKRLKMFLQIDKEIEKT
jgi:hypothetical protein